jgi:hypothetical protein
VVAATPMAPATRCLQEWVSNHHEPTITATARDWDTQRSAACLGVASGG